MTTFASLTRSGGEINRKQQIRNTPSWDIEKYNTSSEQEIQAQKRINMANWPGIYIFGFDKKNHGKQILKHLET